jgi:recombination protein RecT
MKNQVSKQAEAQKTLMKFLDKDSFKKQLAAVLPKSMTPERLVRIAMTEVRMNPKLAECDIMSFAGAIMRCAQMGLEPSSERKHVHLIPFKNKQAGRTECQVIVGYQGFLHLARRSNVYIESDAVCANDTFEFEKGMNAKLKFAPAMSGERGKIIGAYAMARICLPDGTIIYVHEYMPVSDIEKIRQFSIGSSRDNNPWNKFYESMVRKSPIRRLFKYLPLSDELEAAVSIDEKADLNDQNNSALVEDMLDVSNETGEVFDNVTPKTKADEMAEKLEKQLLEKPKADEMAEKLEKQLLEKQLSEKKEDYEFYPYF